MIGGALRQAGIVAAGALYALDHNVERLADDHANAATLARGIADVPRRDARPGRGRDQHRDLRGRRPGRASARRWSARTCGWAWSASARSARSRIWMSTPTGYNLRCRPSSDRCSHEARRHPPHHGHHRRRPAQRRLLRPRARPAPGQEDGQPGRPDRLPPLLRRRERLRRRRPDVLRVPERPPGPRGSGHGPPDRAPRALGRHARLLGRPARERGRRRRRASTTRCASPTRRASSTSSCVVDVPDAPLPARSTEVPEEHALLGFHAVDAAVADPRKTEALLRDTLGFVERGDARVRGPRRPARRLDPLRARRRPRLRRRRHDPPHRVGDARSTSTPPGASTSPPPATRSPR